MRVECRSFFKVLKHKWSTYNEQIKLWSRVAIMHTTLYSWYFEFQAFKHVSQGVDAQSPTTNITRCHVTHWPVHYPGPVYCPHTSLSPPGTALSWSLVPGSCSRTRISPCCLLLLGTGVSLSLLLVITALLTLFLFNGLEVNHGKHLHLVKVKLYKTWASGVQSK